MEEISESLKIILYEKKELTEKRFACKQCGFNCTRKAELKVHANENHKKEIGCTICEEIFDQTYKLELHLKTHEVESFKCQKCDKSFMLKWRLKKHERAHEITNIKFCHYYNNTKECPFEEIGCMYQHARSEPCRFQSLCRNKLCQFIHSTDEPIVSMVRNETDVENPSFDQTSLKIGAASS